MESDDAELNAKLAALKCGYAHKLVARLEGLLDAGARARAGETDALREAAGEAHKLHGTAGSYGFAEVSLEIGEVEGVLKQMLGGGAETPERWDAVSQRIERALAWARAVANGDS